VDFDHPNLKTVQVSTVDAFQGAEKEIIILSCVRTRQVGFIDSEKRMNVALTRGRRHLLIVGNLACLRKNRLWGRVIQHCQGKIKVCLLKLTFGGLMFGWLGRDSSIQSLPSNER
jgi:superfamily I DNA and/or RNA helicase